MIGAARHAHVACGDCEAVRPGLLGQPVNTLSSLAFVLAAVPVWRRARSVRWRAVAVSAALAGLGSIGYHGPGGRAGKVLHDAGVGALAGSTAVAIGVDRGHTHPAAGLVGAAAVALHAASRTGGPLCRPTSVWQGHAGWHVLAAVAVVLASPAGPRPPPRMESTHTRMDSTQATVAPNG